MVLTSAQCQSLALGSPLRMRNSPSLIGFSFKSSFELVLVPKDGPRVSSGSISSGLGFLSNCALGQGTTPVVP